MTAICQNTSLDSPLNPVLLLEALGNVKHNTKPRNGRVKAIIYDIKELFSLGFDIPEGFSTYTQPISSIFHQNESSQNLTEAVNEWFALDRAARVISSIKSSLVASEIKCPEYYSERTGKLRYHPHFAELMSLYSWRFALEKLVVATSRPKLVTRKHGVSLNPFLTYLNPDSKNPIFEYSRDKRFLFLASSSFVYIQSREVDSVWFSSREHLLQLSDIANQRYMTLITSMIADIAEDNSSIPSDALLKVFQWGDDLIVKYHNTSYKSVKLWEPMMTAELITFKEDPNCNTLGFKRLMREEFINSQGVENTEHLRRSLDELDAILEPYRGQNANVLSQLFGIYRIWGHPTVDGITGVEKLIKLTQCHRAINFHSVSLVTQKWREYFCISYWTKESKWPAFSPESFVNSENSYLLSCLKNNYPVDKGHPEYRLEDWDFVIFDKTFEVPEKFEFSEMISDKATSLDKDELKERCLRFHDIGPSQDRSVIIRWLRSNYQNPLNFLLKIQNEGFDKKSGVCGVYPKEREGKNDPRLIGLMSLERRLFIVITEAMIADFILKYFPEITMTYDQSTLNTRLHHVTKEFSEIKKRPSQSIVTNIDFQKWNSYMREEETLGIFSDFDRLFGLKNVFSRSHELFSDCQFYLADGSITPEWDDNDNMINGCGVWSRHLGGIEGLRQKGWTVFTVVILKYVCEMNQITCQLLGQGDNQVLVTHYYQKEDKSIGQQHETFLNNLDRFLNTIGPPIKKEETWSSSHFFTYGKFPILDGIPLSMSQKRISRCGRLNNEGFVSLDAVLSSTTANLSSATSLCQDPTVLIHPVMMEVIAAFILYLTTPFYGPILHEFKHKLNVKIPNESGKQLRVNEDVRSELAHLLRHPVELAQHLSLIPSSLGGYPVFMITDLIMHGFPDPVTSAIWELKKFWSLLPLGHPLKKTVKKVLNPRFSAYQNPELICQDPTALNLVRGSRPQDQRRRLVFSYLPQVPGIVNEPFLQFLNQAQEQQDDLAEVLFSIDPFHPRICASIYESTPTGRAQAVIKKIEKTRTLETMMVQHIDELCRQFTLTEGYGDDIRIVRAPKNLIDLTRIFEINQVSSLLLIINGFPCNDDVLYSCSCDLAEEWRVSSWGKHLCGVTVAVPMEVLKKEQGISCHEHKNSDLGYIRVQTELEDPSKALTSLGPFKPFFGSTTSEKVKYEGGKIVSTVPPVLKIALQNLRLINWGTPMDSNLSKLITTIFSTITNLDWKALIPKVGGASGTLEHRWSDLKTAHGVSPSVNYTMSTHYTVNTNAFKPELKDELSEFDNVNVNMQSLFSLVATTNHFESVYKVPTKSSQHWHINCRNCIKYVNEEELDIPNSQEFTQLIESLEKQEKVEVLWVPKESILTKIVRPQMFPLIQPGQIRGEWESILTIQIVHWILKEHPFGIDKDLAWTFNELNEVIPIAVVTKCKVERVLPMLTHLMLLQFMIRRITYWYNRSDNPPHLVHDTARK